MTTDLNALRAAVTRILLAMVWLLVPFTALANWLTTGSLGAAALVAAATCLPATVLALRAPAASATRLVLAVTAVSAVSVLLAASAGSALQIDMHMAYFAVLAPLALYADPAVIVAATLATALHHLVLNLLAPSLVFPDGANLARVLLHAVVLLVEACALAWMAHRVKTLFLTAAARLAEAEAAATAARQSQRELAEQQERIGKERALRVAETERAAAELQDVVAALQANLARLARCDLACRIEAPFPAAYERLRTDFNAAVAQLRNLVAARQQEHDAAAAAQSQVVDSLARVLQRLAEGDLTGRIEDAFAPEYDRLRTDFNAAMAKLQDLVGSIVTASAAIGDESADISRVVDDVTRRAERQAASIEQAAASLQQVTATIRESASGAARVGQAVGQVRADAQGSERVMADATAAMAEIQQSAQHIGQIIAVIDDIAFQTSLLALNAGVEAARAGEFGRGFAVVATEVRALAQRSAEAAREIKLLIETSGQHVGRGVTLVDQTGQALARISDQIAGIDGVVSQIAGASQDQSATLGEISTAVSAVDLAIQQNVAVMASATAAAASLRNHAGDMVERTRRLQIDRTTARGRTPARPRLVAIE